ncbi:MAG: thioredoxin 1 [Saprospiraceae bacterium]|jgi:thioredoxin 1
MPKKKQQFKDIVGSEKPTIVDFFATWCGPCKMMKPVLKELSSDLKGKARILKIDIDKNKQLANKLEVRSVPTIAIYQRGRIVWRKSGAMTKVQLAKALKPYLVAEG